MSSYKHAMSVCFRNRESDVIMAITIEQALYPLLLTFSVLGFGVYFPEKANLSIFYSLTIWIIYACLGYYLVIEFKTEKWIFETSTIINILISIFVIIISVIMNFYHNKRFQIFIKRLAAVDSTLEKLGTPKIYSKVHTYVKRMLIGWLMFINIINMNDMTWWWNVIKDHRCLFLFFIYISNHHLHVNVFMDLLLVTLLWYIGTRFDKVNEHMRCLLIKEEYGLRCTWRKTILLPPIHRNIMSTNYYKHVLWTLMHLHLELCQIARELNGIYGIQISMKMISYMIYMIRYCRLFYIRSQSKYILSPLSWLDVQMWLLLYGIRLFCLNYACESVSAKANEMKKMIHQLTNFLRYADVRDEIYQFTLQMIHHPLKFTGFGSFYFGNGFLRKFIMRLIAFVIIIIQMATIPESIYEERET